MAQPVVSSTVDWHRWRPGSVPAANQAANLDQLIAQAVGQNQRWGDRAVQRGSLLASIEDNRLDRLAATVHEGVARGDSADKLERTLRGVLSDTRWADLVATTEMNRAMTQATLDTYMANGVPAKEFLTASDNRVCSLCNENQDAGPVPVNADFPNGDPPCHPGCRCTISASWATLDELGLSIPDIRGLDDADGLFTDLEADDEDLGVADAEDGEAEDGEDVGDEAEEEPEATADEHDTAGTTRDVEQPAPEKPPASMPDEVSSAPDPVVGAQQLADTWNRGHVDGERLASGQGGRGVVRVTLSDGSEAVYRSAQGADEALHEYLAGLVAQALGIPGVRTALVGDTETVSALVPGVMGARLLDAGANLVDLLRLQNGREIGLMDWLTAQADRNIGNFLVDGDSVYPIDHEYANFQWLSEDATAEILSPFSWAWLTDSADVTARDDADRLISPYSSSELAGIRGRLAALEPEFAARGAAGPYEFMMARLGDLEAVAV